MKFLLWGSVSSGVCHVMIICSHCEVFLCNPVKGTPFQPYHTAHMDLQQVGELSNSKLINSYPLRELLLTPTRTSN